MVFDEQKFGMTNSLRFSRSKPVQKGNPHKITVHQHIFPAASMRRFLQKNQQKQLRLHFFDIYRTKFRFAKPEDPIFCADRAWSQPIEEGRMKRIEDRFQKIADRILSAGYSEFNDHELEVIAEFYALWLARAENRLLSHQDIKVEDAFAGRNVFSMDERERTEKAGYWMIPGDGTLPMRYANEIIISFKISDYTAQFASKSWGLIKAVDGEFCVPDKPSHGVIPLTPRLVLRAEYPSSTITKDDLADLNYKMFQCAEQYVFARDLTKCPGFIPDPRHR